MLLVETAAEVAASQEEARKSLELLKEAEAALRASKVKREK